VIFADTSALFAALVSSDSRHAEAVSADAVIRAHREAVWTIDPVLAELWFLLRRELSRDACDRLLRSLLDLGLQREPLQIEHFTRALAIGREWPDQDFSLIDRLAFAAIERVGQLRAWSYDAHFAVIRLGADRRLALQLV
jgi:predicted nucleic acid-binding protein